MLWMNKIITRGRYHCTVTYVLCMFITDNSAIVQHVTCVLLTDYFGRSNFKAWSRLLLVGRWRDRFETGNQNIRIRQLSKPFYRGLQQFLTCQCTWMNFSIRTWWKYWKDCNWMVNCLPENPNHHYFLDMQYCGCSFRMSTLFRELNFCTFFVSSFLHPRKQD